MMFGEQRLWGLGMLKIAVVFQNREGMEVKEEHIDRLKSACRDADVVFVQKPEKLVEAGFKADILVCWTTGGGSYICEDYCRYDDRLKWIASLSSGTEGLMADPVVRRPGLLVTSAKGIHGIPMANQVMGYILCFLRKYPFFSANKQTCTWSRTMPDEATGKRLCIIGLGNIGREVARKAKAFDMQVVGTKNHVVPVENVDTVFPESKLNNYLAESDFVLMLLPINDSTRNFMDAERFAAMKKGSIFINVGRGKTVDEKALIAALQSGHLGGAALDTFQTEPLPADSPLWDMKNVIITPHVAADSPLYMTRAFDLIARNLSRYQEGLPLLSQVDLVNQY